MMEVDNSVEVYTIRRGCWRREGEFYLDTDFAILHIARCFKDDSDKRTLQVSTVRINAIYKSIIIQIRQSKSSLLTKFLIVRISGLDSKRSQFEILETM